jgi:hypothetical protein
MRADAVGIHPAARGTKRIHWTIPGAEGGILMYYGVFGGYTRWAVVFLIIFVLFFLLVPGYVTTCTTTPIC